MQPLTGLRRVHRSTRFVYETDKKRVLIPREGGKDGSTRVG
jgi:hypothetical protein